jgi:hypothetical protein
MPSSVRYGFASRHTSSVSCTHTGLILRKLAQSLQVIGGRLPRRLHPDGERHVVDDEVDLGSARGPPVRALRERFPVCVERTRLVEHPVLQRLAAELGSRLQPG